MMPIFMYKKSLIYFFIIIFCYVALFYVSDFVQIIYLYFFRHLNERKVKMSEDNCLESNDINIASEDGIFL